MIVTIQKDKNGDPIKIKPEDIYEFIATIKSVADSINVKIPNEQEYDDLIREITSSRSFQAKRAALKAVAATGNAARGIFATASSCLEGVCNVGSNIASGLIDAGVTVKNTGSIFGGGKGRRTRKKSKKHLKKKNMNRK